MTSNESNPRPVRKARSRKINRVGSRHPEIATREAKTIGQRIARRRVELNLKQEQVARQVTYRQKSGRKKETERRLSRATLAMYERDLAEPDLQKIIAIAAALSVTPSWLAFGDGELLGAGQAASEESLSRVHTDWVAVQIVRNPKAVSSPPCRCLVIRRPHRNA